MSHRHRLGPWLLPEPAQPKIKPLACGHGDPLGLARLPAHGHTHTAHGDGRQRRCHTGEVLRARKEKKRKEKKNGLGAWWLLGGCRSLFADKRGHALGEVDSAAQHHSSVPTPHTAPHRVVVSPDLRERERSLVLLPWRFRCCCCSCWPCRLAQMGRSACASLTRARRRCRRRSTTRAGAAPTARRSCRPGRASTRAPSWRTAPTPPTATSRRTAPSAPPATSAASPPSPPPTPAPAPASTPPAPAASAPGLEPAPALALALALAQALGQAPAQEPAPARAWAPAPAPGSQRRARRPLAPREAP